MIIDEYKVFKLQKYNNIGVSKHKTIKNKETLINWT